MGWGVFQCRQIGIKELLDLQILAERRFTLMIVGIACRYGRDVSDLHRCSRHQCSQSSALSPAIASEGHFEHLPSIAGKNKPCTTLVQ